MSKGIVSNRISDIRDGQNLEENLDYAKGRLFTDGSVNTSVLEILSYLKLFQHDFFKEHEIEIIEMMGLFFKKPVSDTFLSLIFADYHKQIKEEYGEDFTPVQVDILKKIRALNSFSFSAPTSTGKSYVFRFLIKDATGDVAIIVPSRALINEYYDRVRTLLNNKTVNILTFVDKINIKHVERNIFILTPERARELFNLKSQLNIELVLFDEAQLSDEDSVRGLFFDSIVRRVQKAFPKVKIVFSHPFIANPEAQLKRNNINVDEHAIATRYEQKNVGQIFYSHDAKEFYHFGIDKNVMGAQKVKASFDPIEKAIKDGGSVLIFVAKAKIYDGRIYKDFGKYIDMCTLIDNDNARGLIDQLKQFIGASNETNDDYFSKILDRMKCGIVVHHGSMPLTARLILEHFTQQGFCRICFATSTLEQGINMPFDVVYLDRLEASKPLSVKNLIGRAGRSTSDSVFDIGATIVKNNSMSSFRNLALKEETIDEVSHLDKDDEKLDEKYHEFKAAIKNDQFNDEYNLTNSDVKKLTSTDIDAIVPRLLDIMFEEDGSLVYPKWDNEEENERKAMYDNFRSLYLYYLGRPDDEGLTAAEISIVNQAIKIMLWRVYGKTFKLICQYRYDYVTKKKERKNSGYKNLTVSFIKGYDDIPNKQLQNYPLISQDKKVWEVDYDRIIYDTYDYLDKLIGFKLSDIYYAIFHQYWKKFNEERALRLAMYIKYGTDNEREIWMLRYGFNFEDIEWVAECIDKIDDQEIVFNSNIENLPEEQRAIADKYYYPR